jgi:hypothetical protein
MPKDNKDQTNSNMKLSPWFAINSNNLLNHNIIYIKILNPSVYMGSTVYVYSFHEICKYFSLIYYGELKKKKENK